MDLRKWVGDANVCAISIGLRNPNYFLKKVLNKLGSFRGIAYLYGVRERECGRGVVVCGKILNFKPKDMSIVSSVLIDSSSPSGSEREELLDMYSDYHKEAYGFRPSNWSYIYAKTTEELLADFAIFAEECKVNAEAEAAWEAKSVEKFKAAIANTISIGAGDEATALRWIVEAAVEKYGWDYEHYLWSVGILHTDYGKRIGKRIAPIFSSYYAATLAV